MPTYKNTIDLISRSVIPATVVDATAVVGQSAVIQPKDNGRLSIITTAFSDGRPVLQMVGKASFNFPLQVVKGNNRLLMYYKSPSGATAVPKMVIWSDVNLGLNAGITVQGVHSNVWNWMDSGVFVTTKAGFLLVSLYGFSNGSTDAVLWANMQTVTDVITKNDATGRAYASLLAGL